MPHARKAHPTVGVSCGVFLVTDVICPRLQLCVLLLQVALATPVLCIQRLLNCLLSALNVQCASLYA